MSDYIIDHQRGPHIRDYSDLSQDRVVVCSPTGWWTAVGWWKAKGRGFTSLQMAGVFTRDEAYKMSRRRKQEFGTCFHSVPADHVPTLQAKLSEAHRVIMEKCCPGPENWQDGKEWWQVAADRIDALTGILRAGKDDLWAATHGSDEGGFEPTDWVIAAEKELVGDSHVPTLQAEVDRLREAAQTFIDKMRKVEDSPEYYAVWVTAQLHNGQYTGPTWQIEFEDLRTALAATAPKE